ncbi:MAG: DoxX family protein [Bdellovibrionales bacterium]|nr:DoxX family protein [Bdellovibrionales bacterium]
MRFTLAVGFIYHGLWNLSPEGMSVWATDINLPQWLRPLIGGAEIAASVGIAVGKWMRLAAGGLSLIMVGAIVLSYDKGFSFKHSGWEAPWLYLMICLAVVCAPKK